MLREKQTEIMSRKATAHFESYIKATHAPDLALKDKKSNASKASNSAAGASASSALLDSGGSGGAAVGGAEDLANSGKTVIPPGKPVYHELYHTEMVRFERHPTATK
jgi:hypothetical protein